MIHSVPLRFSLIGLLILTGSVLARQQDNLTAQVILDRMGLVYAEAKAYQDSGVVTNFTGTATTRKPFSSRSSVRIDFVSSIGRRDATTSTLSGREAEPCRRGGA